MEPVRADAGAPLVEARDLRIDVDGRPVLSHATFAIEGPSAVVTGDGYALLAAIAKNAQVVAGSLLVEGTEVGTSAHLAWTGFAPLDPPFCDNWTALEYVGWGARLGGVRATDADRAAARTVDRLGLAALAHSPIARLSVVEKRALVVAHAVASEPRLLICAALFSGLDLDASSFLHEVHSRACDGRLWLASVRDLASPSPERALATRATQVLDFVAGTLVRKGPLSDLETGAAGYELRILGNVGAFEAILAERGLRLQGGPGRHFVALAPPFAPNDLLAWSIEAKASIVELALRLKPPGGC